MISPGVLSATDHVPPVMTLSPTGNISGNVNLIASVSDNDKVAGVQLKIDGGNYNPEITTPPYQATVNTKAFSNGAHTFGATARDRVGNTKSITNNVTILNAPTMHIAPASGTFSGVITLSASCDSNCVLSSVQFQVDGANYGSPVGSPFQISLDTMGLTNGNHSIAAIGTDTFGQTSSDTAFITISNVPAKPANSGGPTGYTDEWVNPDEPDGGWDATGHLGGPNGPFIQFGVWKAKGFNLQVRCEVNYYAEGKGVQTRIRADDGLGNYWSSAPPNYGDGDQAGDPIIFYSPWITLPYGSGTTQLRCALDISRSVGGSYSITVHESHLEYQWV